MWDDEPEAAREPADKQPPRQARTKAVTIAVVSLVMLATLWLCCIAAGQVFRLIELDGSSLF